MTEDVAWAPSIATPVAPFPCRALGGVTDGTAILLHGDALVPRQGEAEELNEELEKAACRGGDSSVADWGQRCPRLG